MKQTLANEATTLALNWPSMLLAGMGITLPVGDYIGGMFFALAAASVMAGTRKDTRKIWLMILSAIICATAVAVGWSFFSINFPVQLAMAAVGLTSKWIVNFIAKFMDRVEDRADDIADDVIDKVADKKDDQ